MSNTFNEMQIHENFMFVNMGMETKYPNNISFSFLQLDTAMFQNAGTNILYLVKQIISSNLLLLI